MFEKEAIEFSEQKSENFNPNEPYDVGYRDGLEIGFMKGAELGYNKANEWHYVNWKYFADKDYPESESASYLVRLRNKDTLICEWETEEGFGCFWDNNLEPIDNDDVYAWKEIVPPEEIEK